MTNACHAEIIGHIEVDFVASREQDRLRLWAVDLNVNPTASLSGFQLFDFLAAGQFDPVSGTYWVPGMPDVADVDFAMLPEQAAMQPGAISSADTLQALYANQGAHQDEMAAGVQPTISPNHAVDGYDEGLNTASDDAAGTAIDRQSPAQVASTDSQFDEEQQTEGPPHHAAVVQSIQPNQAEVVGSNRVGAASDIGVEVSGSDVGHPTQRPVSQSPLEDFGDEDDEVAQAAGHGLPVDDLSGQYQSLPDTNGVSSRDELVSHTGLGGVDAAWAQAQPSDMQQQFQLQPRFYASIDLLLHSGMHKQRSAQFLQNCRLAGLGFDMMARQGLVLNFMDSMSSCCLGLQCAGATPQAALQGLSKVSQGIHARVDSEAALLHATGAELHILLCGCNLNSTTLLDAFKHNIHTTTDIVKVTNEAPSTVCCMICLQLV